MKRRRVLIAAVLAALCVTLWAPATVAAEESGQVSPDAVLTEALAELGEGGGLSFDRQPLYDAALSQLGYVYEFVLDGQAGFAILRRERTDYSVEELYFGADNPYRGRAKPVYAGFMKYLSYEQGGFLDLLSGRWLFGKDLYEGNSFLSSRAYDIVYSRRTVGSRALAGGLPQYTSCSYPNSCANVAGAVVVGFYDRYYENLIPGWSAYAGGRYQAQSAQSVAVADDLYFRMKTDVNGGTTYSYFVSGLREYFQAHGRSLTVSSVLSGGNVNMSTYRSALDKNRPVVLFLQGYNVTEFYFEGGGNDYAVSDYYAGNHVMVAGGYKEISYYQNVTVSKWSPVWYNPFRFVNETEEHNIRNDTYLKVSAAIPGYSDGYIRLNDGADIRYAAEIAVA